MNQRDTIQASEMITDEDLTNLDGADGALDAEARATEASETADQEIASRQDALEEVLDDRDVDGVAGGGITFASSMSQCAAC